MMRALGALLFIVIVTTTPPALSAPEPVRMYNCMGVSEEMAQRFEQKLSVRTALLRSSCGEMWAPGIVAANAA